MLIYFRSA